MTVQRITKARLAHAFVFQGEEAVAWFATNRGSEAADQIKQTISKGLRAVSKNPEVGKVVGKLPRRYRRATARPYYIFYRLDYERGEVFIFLLRHESQRTYSDSTIRSKALEAERGSSIVYSVLPDQTEPEQKEDEELACSLQPQQLRLR